MARTLCGRYHFQKVYLVEFGQMVFKSESYSYIQQRKRDAFQLNSILRKAVILTNFSSSLKLLLLDLTAIRFFGL